MITSFPWCSNLRSHLYAEIGVGGEINDEMKGCTYKVKINYYKSLVQTRLETNT